ncbi:YopT family protein [Bacillus subtilis]|uniref:YopT family protein n=1 Tax=Bacillus subtilis TaxID=1423 RepID=UPI001EDF9D14|nr:YopT family protein [Bacillus subtilis]MCG3227877.1 YopT family protein [Bacillus subtilis]MEC1960758.1 YopT family protein [Bacillus subtilis]
MAGFLNNIELNLEIVLKNKADSPEVSETLVTRICENLLLSKEISFLKADGSVENFKLSDIEYEITNTEELPE